MGLFIPILSSFACGGGSGTGDSGVGDGGTGKAGDGGPTGPRISPIETENALPGDGGWMIERDDDLMGAYTEKASYAPGDTIWVHAARREVGASATWQLWRLGWYGGAGGRLIAAGGPIDLPHAPSVTIDGDTGMVMSGWDRTFSIDLPSNAVTGAYALRLESSHGAQYGLVVVRDPEHAAPILVTIPINTYQAYNDWGGTSLYANTRDDWAVRQAFAVTFDRPYAQGNGLGLFRSQDLPFVQWAEAQGYDLEYATDADLDADRSLVDGRKMIVAQGHTEYWTGGMRDHMEGALAAGTHLAFLGANDCFWQARYDDSHRVLTSYKQFAEDRDPMMSSAPGEVTTNWRKPPVNRPEDALIGIMFGNVIFPDYFDLTVADASSWVWTGADVRDGEVIEGVYGVEIDRRSGLPSEPQGVEVLGSGDIVDDEGASGVAETTIYTAASGGQVFAAGSISWARALSVPDHADARIQHLTANLFARFAGAGTLGELRTELH